MTWIIVAVAVCVVIGLWFVFFYDDTTIHRAQPIEFLERFLPTLARTTEGSALLIEPDSSSHVLTIVKNRLIDSNHLEVTFAVEWPVELNDQESAVRIEMAEFGLHPRWERSHSGESILKIHLSGMISELYRELRQVLDLMADTLEIDVDGTFTFYIKGQLGRDSVRMDQKRWESIARQSNSKIPRRIAERQLRKLRNDE